ncbi:hypothetical protein AB0911_37165 [Streptomyces nigra]|uniref:hypothetical protein n=1 Tax=Streptomyces nigra TaxID=1827580 RepID=UPI00345721B7
MPHLLSDDARRALRTMIEELGTTHSIARNELAPNVCDQLLATGCIKQQPGHLDRFLVNRFGAHKVGFEFPFGIPGRFGSRGIPYTSAKLEEMAREESRLNMPIFELLEEPGPDGELHALFLSASSRQLDPHLETVWPVWVDRAATALTTGEDARFKVRGLLRQGNASHYMHSLPEWLVSGSGAVDRYRGEWDAPRTESSQQESPARGPIDVDDRGFSAALLMSNAAYFATQLLIHRDYAATRDYIIENEIDPPLKWDARVAESAGRPELNPTYRARWVFNNLHCYLTGHDPSEYYNERKGPFKINDTDFQMMRMQRHLPEVADMFAMTRDQFFDDYIYGGDPESFDSPAEGAEEGQRRLKMLLDEAYFNLTAREQQIIDTWHREEYARGALSSYIEHWQPPQRPSHVTDSPTNSTLAKLAALEISAAGSPERQATQNLSVSSAASPSPGATSAVASTSQSVKPASLVR